MNRIHLLLTPDNKHNKVFTDIPIIGFCRAKSLKDILVRTKIPHIKKKIGEALVEDLGPRYEICKHIVPTRSFTTKRAYDISLENLNYRFKNVVCLICYKTCHKQCTGSLQEFRARFNNY